MKILVVEDEKNLSIELSKTLTDQRYIVDIASDGEEALDRIFSSEYDLVLLDIMLPHLDGMEVLKEIRNEGIDTPVIMLTAKNSVADKVQGLDHGADDYLAKPFSTSELFARIRSLLRRHSKDKDIFISAGKISLNTKSRQVFKSGVEISLTPKEFYILEFLLYNKNRVISRSSIAEHIWGDDFDPFTMSNFIDVHIKNLRNKLGDSNIIKTIRGIGFSIKDA